MISKRLHPKWTAKHKEYMHKGIKATISVAEGAVRAGKTVDNVAMFAKMLELGVQDKIHLASGSTSANAKLNIGDCNGFGLEYIFRGRCKWSKFKGNECLRIKTANREYIVIFVGGSKADSFKKIRGNSYGMWIATEINLHHDSFIKDAFNRQLASKTRRVFWDLNPSSPANFIYKDYIDKFEETYGERYNYEHFTIRDNASITEERIRDIESQYDKNSVWYRRDILGERCNAEGLVYPMFNKDIHVVRKDAVQTEGDYYVSSDYGIQNATVFLLWQKEVGSKRWICLNEYYYSGRDNHYQKTVSEHVKGLIQMLNGIEPRAIIVDPSASALITEIRRKGYHVRRADNDVKEGIDDVSTMLANQLLAFCDCCVNTIGEFGIYSWDEKASERGEDAPLKENDHAMDATRYFVRTKYLVRRTNKGE
jgi:PBSX family phage terminase large subunit